jgi:hypothetical protein
MACALSPRMGSQQNFIPAGIKDLILLLRRRLSFKKKKEWKSYQDIDGKMED